MTRGLFRNQWDDYYERALSYMEGECYEAAISDMEKAIEIRPMDQRMARTYGMHFVDYFPNREKGLIHFLMGNLDDAGVALALSLEQERSDKAIFYMDRVREKILARDRPPLSIPAVRVTLPSGVRRGAFEIWTRDDPVVLSGHAKDEHYISEVLIADSPVFMEGSSRFVTFREELDLDAGENEIRIIARNLSGGASDRTILVRVDRAGPIIIMERFTPGVEALIRLVDETGVASLAADGKPPFWNARKDSSAPTEKIFSIPLAPGVKELTLTASDILGNRTRAFINRAVSTHGSAPIHPNRILIAGEPFVPAPAAGRKPVILLSGWPDDETVFREHVQLEGLVTAGNNLETVSINGRRIPAGTGKTLFFSETARLRPGKNSIEVRAEDESGAKSIKEIRVTREKSEVFRRRHRYGFVIRPFDHMGGMAWSGFHAFFLKNMEERGRFRIRRREKSETAKNRPGEAALTIVKRHSRNEPDSEGRPPRATLFGIVYETRNGVEIAIRLVDNRTSEVMAIMDAYSESKGRSALKALGGRLTEKFHMSFPLLHGDLVRLIGKKRGADFDEGRAEIDWPLIVFKEAPKFNPVTGASLGADSRIVGDARVDGLTERGCEVELLIGRTLEAGSKYKVITR